MKRPAVTTAKDKTEEAPLPDKVPAKRRQVEALLDVWIAIWLAGDTLTPSERRRLEEEKARRKAASPERVVGFFDEPRGMTPEQRDRLKQLLEELAPTKVIHQGGYRGAVSKFHGLCLHRGIPIEQPVPEPEIAKQAAVCIATPKDHSEPERKMDRSEGVWGAIRYARHRGVPVTIIWPNGQTNNGGTDG